MSALETRMNTYRNIDKDMNNLIINNMQAALPQTQEGKKLAKKIESNPEKYLDYSKIDRFFDDIIIVGNQMYKQGSFTPVVIKDIEVDLMGGWDPRHLDGNGRPTGASRKLLSSWVAKLMKALVKANEVRNYIDEVIYKPSLRDHINVETGELTFEVGLEFKRAEDNVIERVQGMSEEDRDIYLNFLMENTVFRDLDIYVKQALIRRVDNTYKIYAAWVNAMTDVGKTHFNNTVRRVVSLADQVDIDVIGTNRDDAGYNYKRITGGLWIPKEEFTIFTNNWKKTGDLLSSRKKYASTTTSFYLPSIIAFSHENIAEHSTTKQMLNRLVKIDYDQKPVLSLLEEKGLDKDILDDVSYYYTFNLIHGLYQELSGAGTIDRIALIQTWKTEVEAYGANHTMQDTIANVRDFLKSFALELAALKNSSSEVEKAEYFEIQRKHKVEIVQKNHQSQPVLRIVSGYKDKMFAKRLEGILQESVSRLRMKSMNYEIESLTPDELGFGASVIYGNRHVRELTL